MRTQIRQRIVAPSEVSRMLYIASKAVLEKVALVRTYSRKGTAALPSFGYLTPNIDGPSLTSPHSTLQSCKEL